MTVPAYGATLLCLVLLLDCRPRQPVAEMPPGPQDPAASGNAVKSMAQMNGTVFMTGSEPDVSITLVPPQGPSVRLVGSLRSELGRLSGATVRVRGVPGGKPPSKTFEVESYDILEVDGDVPRVGTLLATKDGALRLAGRDTIELADPPEELRRREGAKVWIVGRPSGEKLAVQSYGIIREAGEP